MLFFLLIHKTEACNAILLGVNHIEFIVRAAENLSHHDTIVRAFSIAQDLYLNVVAHLILISCISLSGIAVFSPHVCLRPATLIRCNLIDICTYRLAVISSFVDDIILELLS